MRTSVQSKHRAMDTVQSKIAAKWGSQKRLESTASWESFSLIWERAHLLRSFMWTQECADEKILFKQLLIRLRRFFNVDVGFAALCEEHSKTVQLAVPETALDRLPANFVRRTLDLIVNSRAPITWNQLSQESGFRSVVAAPVPAEVGKPMGFILLAHGQQRDFNQAELFVLQTLADELSWALRGMRMKQHQQKVLAGISHELKNSLNVIMGDCTLLRESLDLRLASEQCHELSSIDKMSQEILDLIHKALDANLAPEGRALVVEDGLSLVDLLDDTFSPAREKAKAAQVDLVIDYAEDLPLEVSTDAMRLKQVIRNLVNQAIEFPERAVVQVSAKRKAEVLEITVSGLRLNDNNEDSLRNPAPPANSRGRLELLKEQLEPLAGHMHIVSRTGQGHEITLCVPCL